MEVQHGAATRRVKGEDMILVRRLDSLPQFPPESMLLLICDGHGGKQAAAFVTANFQPLLCSKLPAQYPGPGEDMSELAQAVRTALYETFVALDNRWLEAGLSAGTTITAALLLGPLLSVASIGDSSALLCHGFSHALELTASHRLDNDAERSRMEAAGVRLAPVRHNGYGPAESEELGVGPLRVWPGGLCMTRSLGDIECGPDVLPIPHIKQVLLDSARCEVRLVLASDGVWDVMSRERVLRVLRRRPCAQAAAELCAVAAVQPQSFDDISVLVVDVRVGGRGKEGEGEGEREGEGEGEDKAGQRMEEEGRACTCQPAPPAPAAVVRPCPPRVGGGSMGWLACFGRGGAGEKLEPGPLPPPVVTAVTDVGCSCNCQAVTPSELQDKGVAQQVTVVADEDGLLAQPWLQAMLARRALAAGAGGPGCGGGGGARGGHPDQMRRFAQLVAAWNRGEEDVRQRFAPPPAAAPLRKLCSAGQVLDSSDSNAIPWDSLLLDQKQQQQQLQRQQAAPLGLALLTSASAEPVFNTAAPTSGR